MVLGHKGRAGDVMGRWPDASGPGLRGSLDRNHRDRCGLLSRPASLDGRRHPAWSSLGRVADPADTTPGAGARRREPHVASRLLPVAVVRSLRVLGEAREHGSSTPEGSRQRQVETTLGVAARTDVGDLHGRERGFVRGNPGGSRRVPLPLRSGPRHALRPTEGGTRTHRQGSHQGLRDPGGALSLRPRRDQRGRGITADGQSHATGDAHPPHRRQRSPRSVAAQPGDRAPRAEVGGRSTHSISLPRRRTRSPAGSAVSHRSSKRISGRVRR